MEFNYRRCRTRSTRSNRRCRETLEYHYGKHHHAYVKELNNLLKSEGARFGDATLEQIIRSSSGPLFNNAAQTWNHTFLWNCMTPNGGGEPTGPLNEAIASRWGSCTPASRKHLPSAQ